ncbi:MAG: hypothetical protein ABI665_06385 [Vicinamibacterales bacterium]
MSRIAFVWPAAACAIMGAALYATRGVLDQAVTAGGATRLALLPPWQALLGFVCLAGLVLVGIDHLNAPKGTTAGRRPRLGDLILPLLSLAVLIVPYLPVLPDRWPILQILSGQLRYVVWAVVISQMLWVLWQSRLLTPRWIERWTIRRLTLAIWIITAGLSLAVAERLTQTAVFPSGDEPHYLVIAQSLWRDGDLRIENNHKRGDYREYFDADLDPDYLTRGKDAAIYSVHPIGLPVILAPVYAAAGYRGVVWLLVGFAATAAAIAWRWTLGALNAPGAATFGWAAVAASAPFLFNAFTVYPEIAGALAVMIGFVLATSPGANRAGLARWVSIGFACAVLPWLSTKYAPMSAALLAVAAWRARDSAPLWRNPKVIALAAPYAFSLAAWSAFFYAIWGSPFPQAPYGSMTQTSPLNLGLGVPGLLFDQEYGLLAYAPVYVLAATGLAAMWRSRGELRRQAIEIALVFGALFLTVAAHRLWWGGTSAPARPLASGLLLLMLPIAVAFREAPAGSARRAGQHLLLWVGIGISTTLALAQGGLIVSNFRDGTSALLEWWSPRWEAWTLVPSFVTQTTATALLSTAVWLAVAAAAGAILARWRAATPGAAALGAISTFGGALLLLALIGPWLPSHPPQPRVNLHARARLAALDEYDARALPAAVLYDPLRTTNAPAVVPMLAVDVAPGVRTDPQPLRVIHNGRFSLPAGTYEIDVRFGDRPPARPTAFALQVGRIGPPFETWTVQPMPGEHFHAMLSLPVDANFVGFRASNEMEKDVASITVTPTAVVDAGARPIVPTVLSAARYPGAANSWTTVFMHDEHLYPEATGFWTIGDRPNRVTVSGPADGTTPVVLRMHCGNKANRVTVRTHGWQRSLALVPGVAQDLALPVVPSGVVPLVISTDTGFSPSEADPATRDPRFLGVWIEIAKGPS